MVSALEIPGCTSSPISTSQIAATITHTQVQRTSFPPYHHHTCTFPCFMHLFSCFHLPPFLFIFSLLLLGSSRISFRHYNQQTSKTLNASVSSKLDLVLCFSALSRPSMGALFSTLASKFQSLGSFEMYLKFPMPQRIQLLWSSWWWVLLVLRLLW